MQSLWRVCLLLSLTSAALGFHEVTSCIEGIHTDISEFVFEGNPPEDYYGQACTNKLSVTSLWAAAKIYCTPSEITAGSKALAQTCQQYGFITLIPYSEIAPSLTDDFISSLPIVEYSDIDPTKTWNHSVLISKELYEAGKKTTVGPLSKK